MRAQFRESSRPDGTVRTGEDGFTLLELLIVIVIIAVLAAIAIPTYLNQRPKSWDAAAISDARNVAAMEEAYATNQATYIDFDSTAASPAEEFDGFRSSPDVLTRVRANAALGYCVIAKSRSGKYFVYDSQSGGMDKVGKAAVPAAFPAGSACAAGTPAMP